MAMAVALLLVLSGSHQGTQQAEANDATVNFALFGPGCDTNGGSTTCNIQVNGVGKFTARSVSLGSFAGTVTIWQVVIAWSPGLTGPIISPTPNSKGISANGCSGPPVSGIAAIAAPFLAVPNTAAAVCVALGTPTLADSELTSGNINGSFDITCGATPSAESVTLVINATKSTGTFIGDVGSQAADLASEMLTINCVEPPPPPTPIGGVGVFPDIAGSAPSETPGSPGTNAGSLTGVIAGATAVAATVAGAAWYARRRWLA